MQSHNVGSTWVYGFNPRCTFLHHCVCSRSLLTDTSVPVKCISDIARGGAVTLVVSLSVDTDILTWTSATIAGTLIGVVTRTSRVAMVTSVTHTAWEGLGWQVSVGVAGTWQAALLIGLVRIQGAGCRQEHTFKKWLHKLITDNAFRCKIYLNFAYEW